MQFDPRSRMSKVHGKSLSSEKCSVLLEFRTSLPARRVQLELLDYTARYSLRSSFPQSCVYKFALIIVATLYDTSFTELRCVRPS